MIAIHYENKESINPLDYSEEVRDKVTIALNIMKECQEKGAIIAAVYSIINKNKIIIGEIEKGTEINFTRYDHTDEDLIFKTMQLKNAREINYIDFPILMATHPRQSTIVHWRKIENVIRNIFQNNQLPDDVYSFSPGQLEIICYEYLKQKNLIYSLLMPIGRNLLYIDIVGINEKGQRIFAQVTYADNKQKVEEKLVKLKESIPETDKNTKLLFFAPPSDHIDSIKDDFENIEIIGIENVYDYLKSDENGKLMIDMMLNRI